MLRSLQRVLGLALIGLMLAAPLSAQGVTDDLVSQLRGQGFERVTITRTLLGRVLILATSDDGQREIVLNPQTGEILRDYFRPREQMAALPSNSGDRLTVAPNRDDNAVGDMRDEKGGRGNSGGKGGGKGDGKGSDGSGTADGDMGTGDDGSGDTGSGDTGNGDDGGGRGSEPGGKTPQTGG